MIDKALYIHVCWEGGGGPTPGGIQSDSLKVTTAIKVKVGIELATEFGVGDHNH